MALARRRAAQGHGDDAVPPDDARADRGPDHRGLPRRGRVPAQLGRRALPEELRAERDGARVAATSISRAEQTEIDEGRGIDGNVLLDLRHLGAEKILERLHGTRELSMTFAGIDPIYEPIPVRPGAHYHMGGVDTDNERARPSSTGLYAAGECACVSVHGANRLGGNSLMETITFGRRAGAAAAEWALVAHDGRPCPSRRRGATPSAS